MEQALVGLAERIVCDGGSPSANASRLLAAYVRRPGKRVRPYLCALGYELVSGGQRSPGVELFASGLELLHAFLLVHDDIIDRAVTRRGEPSLHVLLRPAPSPSLPESERQRVGSDLGMVAGDWLYTAALEAMLQAPLPADRKLAALSEVLGSCRETARGQFDDVAFGARPLSQVSPADVCEVYRQKTALYTFEAPLVAGALLGGASRATVEALRRYSEGAGIAYQLLDDLLGLFASEEELGKPPLADLREGKKTWPLLYAYARATPLEQVWLAELFVRGDASLADLQRVGTMVRRTGALEAALSLVGRLCDDASGALEALPVSAHRDELQAVLRWLQRRAGALS